MSDKSHLLEPRYNQQILIAENHLQTKAKGKGTKINKERTDYLVEIGAQCPICGIRFEGGNHNTEHIFPSGLGGQNKNHNKIQMCVACNSARNQILQLLGHPPWYDRYPGNFEHVKKILIWCLITVEDGIHSGKQVPDIHDKFMQYRTGGQEFPNKPTRAFGPASTWVVGDNPNYLHNHSSNNRKPTQLTPNQSLTLSVFDWIFGYKSKDKTKPKKVETSRQKSTASTKEIDKTIIPSTDTFPLITRFNSTSSGLKLPRHPRQFVECLVTFQQKQSEIRTTAEITELFKQILNSSHKAHRMASNTASILFPDDLTPIQQKDWTLANPLDDMLHFSELLRDKILATRIVEEEQEYVAHTNMYFDMVKELL